MLAKSFPKHVFSFKPWKTKKHPNTTTPVPWYKFHNFESGKDKKENNEEEKICLSEMTNKKLSLTMQRAIN